MNLQARVTNILTKPAAEWPVIAAEPADVTSLYTTYIMILAAVPAVSTTLGMAVIGGFFGPVGLAAALAAGVISYVGALIGCFVAAFIIEKLAPTFNSSGNTAQALKLVAYAYTPVWVAGVLHLVPMLGILTILAALYSIYIFYLGLAPVMKTPQDKIVPYMLVSAIAIIVVSFVITALLGMMVGAALLGGAMAGGGRLY